MERSLIFAISGSHSSGKTTLFHQVLGALLRNGIVVYGTQESAREAHFLISGSRDLPLHLEIAALQMLSDVRAARQHRIVLADRCLVDNLAYYRLRARAYKAREPITGHLLSTLTQNYAQYYKHVFLTRNYFPSGEDDIIRKGENTEPEQVRSEILLLLQQFNIPFTELDSNTSLSTIVDKISSCVEQMHPRLL